MPSNYARRGTVTVELHEQRALLEQLVAELRDALPADQRHDALRITASSVLRWGLAYLREEVVGAHNASHLAVVVSRYGPGIRWIPAPGSGRLNPE